MENEYTFNPSTANKHQFPCKNCGGFLTFQPGMKSLVCQFCGTQNEIIDDTTIEIKEIDYKSFIENLANNAPRVQVATVKCTSCGAESTMKPNVTSDFCPFCGTALVLESGTLQTEIKPQALLPFKIPQKQSFSLFKEWINGLWFAPNGLKKYADNHEKLTGMYIPYWTYDSNTYSRYTGERGEYYYVTETYRDEDGNTQTREVQKTRWYPASGSVSHSFDDVLTMGSHSLPANYAQELEPWDLHELAPFNEQYLSGFRAESYQVDVKEGFEIAKRRMDDVIDGLVRQDIGGDTQQVHSINTTYNDITFKHVLLPIWISAYRYNGKVYRFMINGRTGEVQGERPWSWVKITLAVLFVLTIIIGAVYLLQKDKKPRHRHYRNEHIRVEQQLFTQKYKSESFLNI
jgi:Zn finger protein HypA/HybF involved in hydrogenase expression